MNFFLNLIIFIFTIGIITIVHEFGHLWAARRCGIFVERFSIGFGKTLWHKIDSFGTEFVISILPLGGYVKMLDNNSIPIKAKKYKLNFNNVTVNKRIAVISAGALANFILAILTYWFIFMIGVPSVCPIIDSIKPNSIADKIHISAGMKFKSINGINTTNWNMIRLILIKNMGNKKIDIEILAPQNPIPIKKTMNLQHWKINPKIEDPLLSLGIMPIGDKVEPIIKNLKPNSIAIQSGLQIGDKIIKINNEVLNQWNLFDNFIQKHQNKPLLLTINRNGQKKNITLIPETKIINKDKKIEFLGIELSILPLNEKYRIIQKYNIFEALYQSINQAWLLMKLTVHMIFKLIIGQIKINSLTGPISIGKTASISAQSGLIYYLMFIALISINIGIINLFPLPVLDGGFLLFLIIEKIQGKPVSTNIQNISYRIGTIILIILTGLALFNDLSHL